jgi:hypothetical protein
MAESVLDKIVRTKEGREVFQNLSETNKTIQLIYKHQLETAKKQEKWEKDKERDRKKKEQDEKRKKGDPIFQQLFGKKNSEEEKKAKKGLIDLIKDAALGGLQLIGGLLGKIVGPMIGGLGKIFTSVIGSAIKGLAPMLANVFRLALGKFIAPIALPAAGALAAAVGIGVAGKHVTDNMRGGTKAFLDKHSEIDGMLSAGGLTTTGSVRVGRGGSLNPTKPEQVELAKRAKERRDKLNELQKQRDEEIKAIPKTKVGRGGVRSGKTYTEEEQAKHDEIMRKYDEMATKLQTGGHVNVPGTGSGDKIPMWLPPDSFVMNRNAAAMLQSGGLVPTLLEPGEKVFGPGQWGPMEMMMNSMIPRFQTGGEVKPKPELKSEGDKTLYTLATTNKLVNRGEGRCTQSVAHTLDANGIKNPTKNADPNNPRGYAIQFVNKFGWKSVGGAPTSLGGADGAAALGIMPQKDYISNASSGNVPSGSLVFSTRHDDWFGNVSSGYDTAIARNGGKNLWNGKMNGDSIYGGSTKSAIVLVPSDSTLKGNFAGSSTPGVGGESAPGPGMALGLMGRLTGMGAVGSALKDLLGGYKKALGESGWVIDMLAGAGESGTGEQPQVPSGGMSSLQPGKWNSILELIKKYEAGSKGFEAMYPSTKLPGATRMTIAQVAKKATGAVGAWQNLPEYLNARARAVGLDPNKDLYNEANQQKIAEYLIGPGQANVTVDMAKRDPKRAMLQLSKVWAAIPKDDSGKSFYAGVGNNKAHIKPEQMYEAFSKLQKGGVVNLSRAGSSSSNWKQNQQEFANQIARAASSPSIVVVPTGGGNSALVGAPDVTPNQLPPNLPEGPSSAQAIDYFYRMSMGAAY